MLAPDAVETYTSGQCHTFALALSHLLTEQGRQHEIVAVLLVEARHLPDSDGMDVYEDWTASSVTPTQENASHLMVRVGDSLLDASGVMDEHEGPAHNLSLIGHDLDSDEYLLLAVDVTADWTRSLADGDRLLAWAPVDLNAALPHAERLLATLPA